MQYGTSVVRALRNTHAIKIIDDGLEKQTPQANRKAARL